MIDTRLWKANYYYYYDMVVLYSLLLYSGLTQFPTNAQSRP
jgi:hypothetical protein